EWRVADDDHLGRSVVGNYGDGDGLCRGRHRQTSGLDGSLAALLGNEFKGCTLAGSLPRSSDQIAAGATKATRLRPGPPAPGCVDRPIRLCSFVNSCRQVAVYCQGSYRNHNAFAAVGAGSRTPKKIAYSTGVTIKDRTAANDSPNMMHTAIAPKNGSTSSGIIPRTVVKMTMHTGRDLLTPPSRIP